VVSDKMQKTVVVAVARTKRHRLYNKTLRRTKRYKAHDERNECRLGDRVRIVETRPLSKEKRWRVAEILVKGDVAEIQPAAIGAELLEPARGAAPEDQDAAVDVEADAQEDEA
jgi:small subunit ribosomal protein S17